MNTKASLLKDISNMGIALNSTVLIHSSMKSIGNVEGGAETVIDSWMEYMKDGLLIFPTHTWKSIGPEKTLYDSRTEPSCVGVLSNVFMKRLGVIRSLHPTHSVAAFGRDAENYIRGEETRNTPCPRNGCWGKLYDMNAVIIFLGCTLRSNTFIHSVEEWNNIPDRINYKDAQQITIIDKAGNNYSVNMHRHYCSKGLDVSDNYIKLHQIFEEQGAIRYSRFGDAHCIIGNAVKMADITTSLLHRNPNLFIDDLPIT